MDLVVLFWAKCVLARPERFTADEWYKAMVIVLAERAPA
jgi:hypothetical protein